MAPYIFIIIFFFVYSKCTVHMFDQAFRLAEEDWNENFEFTKPQVNDMIILYCKLGQRSEMAAKILKAKGYNK